MVIVCNNGDGQEGIIIREGKKEKKKSDLTSSVSLSSTTETVLRTE